MLLCLRWYCRYQLSYRDVEEMMKERGLSVHHITIFRWVQRYAPEINKRIRPQLTVVLERAKHNTGEQWKRVRETLSVAVDTVHNQSVRYNLKLTEIKLVRWQNRLSPLLYGWEGLTYEQIEGRLKPLALPDPIYILRRCSTGRLS